MTTERLLAKRSEIVAAASRVFREEGYEAASMDRIAEAAGASKRTVYNHFGSKDALFEAILTPLMDARMEAKRIDWDPSVPVADQLRMFARVKSDLAEHAEAMGLLRVLLGVAISRPEVLEKFVSKYATHDQDALVAWLKDAHAARELSVPHPVLSAQVFWAMAGGALFWPATIGIETPRAEREQITTEIIEMFLARHRAP